MVALHSPLNLQHFVELCEQQAKLNDYPLAASVEKNIVCYDAQRFAEAEQDAGMRIALLKELAHVLLKGSGVLAIRGAFPDSQLLEQHNELFEVILEQERSQTSGDHFAQSGANGRIWNAFQKIALHNPQAFIDYYKNPVLGLIAESWLGPHYQITAQVNIVRPGGAAQQPHRDYHLGFQALDELKQYPPHVHRMSAQLTLQGAVAHTDMPLESGPTQLLPFSQQYPEGYLAWHEGEFIEHFRWRHVQLALKQGDALFFTPALFHAAGANHTSGFHRSANLLQISSPFGRAMESVDQYAISVAIYPQLTEQFEGFSSSQQQAILEASCESYSFPSNLDRDAPVAGMAPETHRQLTERALTERWATQTYKTALKAHQQRRIGRV